MMMINKGADNEYNKRKTWRLIMADENDPDENDPIAFLKGISWDEGQDRRYAYYWIVDDKTFNECCLLVEGQEQNVLVDDMDDLVSILNNMEQYEIKLYEALHFLLSGLIWECVIYNELLSNAVGGYNYFCWPVDPDSYGVFTCIENDALQEIIEALENVNIKELETSFDLEIFKNKHVPYMWLDFTKDEWIKALIKEYTCLLDFYRKAKERNAHIIINLYGLLEYYDEDDIIEDENDSY
jgi:hypothetical protein